MADEITTTTELEGAAANAEVAAQQANEATAAATGAAINQGQLIEAVTAASREDAQRARDQSEQAAAESQAAAELSALTAETLAAEVRALLEEHSNRLSALENRPAVSVAPTEEAVSPIDPAAVQEEQHAEATDTSGEKSTSSRKRHGRRRR
ncbi:MAG: hypothetical protein ACRETA_04440 [Gammaproteobacteria bacterium]